MSKGKDTIGRGTAHHGPASISKGKGQAEDAKRNIEFDTPRYNNPSGRARELPYKASDNAAKVAEVMLRQETEQKSAGMKFRIGENQAKRIDHDAPPK